MAAQDDAAAREILSLRVSTFIRDAVRELEHNTERIKHRHIALRDNLELLARKRVPLAVLKALVVDFDVDAKRPIRIKAESSPSDADEWADDARWCGVLLLAGAAQLVFTDEPSPSISFDWTY